MSLQMKETSCCWYILQALSRYILVNAR